ncbi:MAG TPA: acyl-CoA dehydrogenase [Acidimicrobiales bacterium]|nr:acyl-CoA dehydrogenase [Acidimicrobiales bacterium]
MAYEPPLDDIRFALEHLVDLRALTDLEPFADADPDTVIGVLEEAGRFMAEVLGPLHRVGDTDPARWHDPHTVTTPPGFKDAYRRYVDAGWGAVPFDPGYGGGGFPWLVTIVIQEMMTAANMGFSLCPLLTQGAIDMLLHHGNESQQQTYLPHMVTGEWTGTMNLTEPEAGSDVGALRTKAEPRGDGTYAITGQKIFITYGEHDLTEQIVHLVLARTPGAPPGTKGISCFIVPKYLVRDDGSLGERNALSCVSIEHKMGIHASPTCVMSYEGATGFLIGEENSGMRYMFTMMNSARLSVGLEGLAVGEAAYQQAVAYAKERLQGRAITAGTPRTPGTSDSREQAPIVEHADVRRMLLTIKAYVQAMRGLVYLNAECLDLAAHHPDEGVRTWRRELADLLTPITKAWCTDLGNECASLNVQVHGGMGYIEESGAPQLYRDIRIAPIYEGTNGIQAMDLVGRKLPMRGGGAMKDLLAELGAVDAELAAAGDAVASIRTRLAEGVRVLSDATDWMFANGLSDPNDAFAGSAAYLRIAGLVVGGWVMARTALAASGSDDPADADRVVTARFYCETLLPQASGLLAAATAGAGDLAAATF